MQTRARRAAAVAVFGAVALTLILLLRSGAAPWLLRLLKELDTRPAKTPEAFGLFHFLWMGICLLMTGFAVLFAWRMPEQGRGERIDRNVFACGAAFFWLELLKQLFWCFVLSPDDYPFQVFPFQFCSLPIYFCLLAPILPWRAARTTCYRFLALYGTVGGCLVIGYPDFPDVAALCFHTMIWHSLMIAMGIYLLIVTQTGERFLREWFPATAVFLGSFAAATALNVAMNDLPGKTSGPLNLFYMNPYRSTYFWGISDLWERFGWGVAALGYLVLFAVGAAIPLWFLGYLFRFLQRKIKPRTL